MHPASPNLWLAVAFAGVSGLNCQPGTTTSSRVVRDDTPGRPPRGQLINPRNEDGRPVMLGFDDHHPDCFTFPAGNHESEKVDCPKGAQKTLHDCRGAWLYALSAARCRCVPVSDGEVTEGECPDGVELTPVP